MTETSNDFHPTVSYFLKSAKARPEKTALVDGHWKLTYGELERRSRVVSEGMVEISDQYGWFTGSEHPRALIWMDSNAWAVISILAASRAGFSYVFLEPNTAADFAREVAEQFQPNLVLVTEGSSGSFEHKTAHTLYVDGYDSDDAFIEEAVWDMDAPAMSYFTSGSTGKPKGLSLSQKINAHRTLENTLFPFLNSEDVIALSMSFSFVRSSEAMWMAFARGATAMLYRFQDHSLLEAVNWVDNNGLTILQMPSNFADRFIQTLHEHPEYKLKRLRMISVGGEKLGLEAVRLYQNTPGLNFIFRYQIGSSETSSYYYTDYERNSSLGETLSFESVTTGSEVFLLNDDGVLIRREGSGEIHVASEKLFLGYMNPEDGVEHDLIPRSDVPGGKLFPTGDLAEINSRGEMRLVGRKDKMIKVRGYRMDLEEIRHQIESLPRVNEAFVKAHKNKRDETIIAAYIAFETGQEVSITKLRDELLSVLNPYKIPTKFTILPNLPRGTSGKVLSNELPAVDQNRPRLDNAFQAAEGETQKALVQIWENLLDINGIGVTDSFFELGGDSISVLEMVTIVEDQLGIKVPPDFVEEPTILNLAGYGSDSERTSAKEYSSAQIATARQARKEHYSAKVRKSPLTPLILFLLDRLTFDQAFNLLGFLARSWVVQNVLYIRHKKIFSRWLTQLSISDFKVSFQKYIFANLTQYLTYGTRATRASSKTDPDEADMKFLFDKSFQEALRNTPPHVPLARFPIFGSKHLTIPAAAGKPVILVSYHSNVPFGKRELAERIAGRGPFVTVTHNLGRVGKYTGENQAFTTQIRDASNAEISLDAINQIRSGRILVFMSDTQDPMTKNHVFSILGRETSLKDGFAEIGEMVGAEIIPMAVYITDDLRVAREFFPPLRSEKTTSEERVHDLVRQYAAFLERMYTEHPETMANHKIKNFFGRNLS